MSSVFTSLNFGLGETLDMLREQITSSRSPNGLWGCAQVRNGPIEAVTLNTAIVRFMLVCGGLLRP